MVTTSRTPSSKKSAAKAKETPAKKPGSTTATPKKSVPKKPAAEKKPVATSAVKKTGTPKAAKKSAVTPEQRYQMIAIAAYHLAERRGFEGGSEVSDWIAAEMEIDAHLKNR